MKRVSGFLTFTAELENFPPHKGEDVFPENDF